jgi:pimeloyl-ACP methyl ester carboxylesterase
MHDPAVDTLVSLRGLRFHYREYGRASDPPIVLLHGVASNARIWITTAPTLAQGSHVLALDQRGHGQSDKPDSGYDFASVTSDLLAFIDELKLQRPVVAGHSWGGNVALEFAAKYPDRLAGLVLVDGGFMELSSRDGMTWERAEKEMAPPELTHLTREQLLEGAKKWELGSIWSEEVGAALMGNFEITEAGTIRPNLRRENHMQVVRALWEQRPSELCAHVRCPVLFIGAEREGSARTREWLEMKRESITRMAKLLPRCEVRWFENTIHDIPLHRPAELAQAIEEFTQTLER